MTLRDAMYALLPVAGASILQRLLWDWLDPYVWILFGPAVLISAWLGRAAGGLIATVLSVVLAWAFFMPSPVAMAMTQGQQLGPVLVFGVIGIAMSFLVDRLHSSANAATRGQVAAEAAVDELEQRVRHRTAELEESSAALRISEAAQRAIVDNLIEGLAVIDLEGHLIQANRSIVALHGFRDEQDWRRHASELAGEFELRTLGGVVCPFEQWPVSRILRGEKLNGLELRLRRIGSANERIVSYGGSIIVDAESEPLFAILTAADVTERKLTETGLRMFASLAENSVEFIGMSDLDGIPFFANEAALRLVGLADLEEAKRTPLHDFFFPEDRSFVIDEFLPRVRREGHAEVEIRFRHFRTAEPIWMIYNVFVVRDERDEPTAFAMVSRDISDRKRAETALQRANESLEAKVAERTVELQEAKDSAVSADRLKSEFLTHMSHELRTPLNAIIGFTGTLLLKLPGPLNAEQVRQLETVQSSARHLLALINDILDVAKIEAGRTQTNLEPVACRSVVEEVMQSLAEAARRKGLVFEASLPDEPLVLRTDRKLLRQILLNLVGNAIKFTDRGRVHVILARGDARLGEAVSIAVEDTGIGIPAQKQNRLFERFAQMDPEKDRTIEGTGLGLYLSKHLAELLGGRITFRSEFGKGSVFALTLKAAA